MEEDEEMEAKIEITDCDFETTPTTIQYVAREPEFDILTQSNIENKYPLIQNTLNKKPDFEIKPETEIKTEITDCDIEMTPTTIQYVARELEFDISTKNNIESKCSLMSLENTSNKNLDFEIESETEIKTEITDSDIEMTPTTIQYVAREPEFDISTKNNIESKCSLMSLENTSNKNLDFEIESGTEIKTEIKDSDIEMTPTTMQHIAKESIINILTESNTQNKSPLLLNTVNKDPNLEVAKNTGLKTETSDSEIENTPTIIQYVAKETDKISLKQKYSERLLECHVCSIGFLSQETYDKHMLCHARIPDSGPTCTMCDVMFATERGFILHCRITHDEFKIKTRQNKSSEAKQIKSAVNALKAKEETGPPDTSKEDIENKLEPNQCVIRDQGLDIDIKTSERTSDICIKAFTERLSLQTDENPYKCNMCDKVFNRSSKLKEHERIHINERPFKCNICAKGFTAGESLRLHQSIHANEKPYKCYICDVGFNRISSWKRHEKNHTVKSKTRKSTSSKKLSSNAVKVKDLNEYLELQQKDSENNSAERSQNKQSGIGISESKKGMRKYKHNNNKSIEQLIVKTMKGTLRVVQVETLANAVKVLELSNRSPEAAQEDIKINLVQPIQDKQLNIENLDTEKKIRKRKYIVQLKEKPKRRKHTSSKEQEETLAKGKKANELNRSLEVPQKDVKINSGKTIQDKQLSTNNSETEKSISKSKYNYKQSINKITEKTSKGKGTSSKELLINEKIHTNVKPFKCNICDKKCSSMGSLKAHQRIHTGERPYKCNLCDKRFSDKGTLKKHLRIHTGEKPFKCKICGKNFSRLSDLKSHERIHTGEKPYKCNLCNKIYTRSFNLKLHKLTHSTERPFKCNICDKAFTADRTLRLHERTHNTERPHKCYLCDKRYANTSLLKTHVRTHYNERPYQCDICDKRFNYRSSIKNHKIIHTGEKPYKCNICDKVFSRTTHLKSHLKIHTGEQPYKCNICDKRFSHKSSLNSHLRRHKNEKLYQCDVCKKRFNILGQLKVHLRVHTGERAFKCNVCDRSFPYSASLRGHERTHTNERLYKCKVCDKRFSTTSRRKTHELLHTGVRPYKCDICNKGYTQNNQLNVHKRVHTGEKPYKCKICDKSCMYLACLKQHVITDHTTVKPYKCNVCNKSFKQKSNMTRHVRTHTGE